jgi:hypothetical protein
VKAPTAPAQPFVPPPPALPGWLSGVRVGVDDEPTHVIRHLGHMTFSVDGTDVAPYRVLPATFAVDDTLSVTTMAMAYPREPNSGAQLFSFVEVEPDVLACLQAGLTGGSARWLDRGSRD